MNKAKRAYSKLKLSFPILVRRVMNKKSWGLSIMDRALKYFGKLFEIILVGLVAALIAAVFVGGAIAPDILSFLESKKGNPVVERSIDGDLEKTGEKGHREEASNIGEKIIAQASKEGSIENTSKIFETYGRLITTVVSLMTVLGVFFVYFSRKSHRELEEEIRQVLHDKLAEANRIKEESIESLESVTRLKADCEKLFKTLDSYHKSSDSLKRGRGNGASINDVKSLDDELEKAGI